jgi:AcrR family transcriptional regulator
VVTARPSRPGLSRDYIVATALALLDREGLKGLSMRRLGAELGVDPMAVYYHLPKKAGLFDAVVEAIYNEVALPTMPSTRTWRDQVEWFGHQLRSVLCRHPNALPIVGTRPIFTPSMLAMLDEGLGAITAHGVSDLDALDILNCVATFTIGHALAEVGEPVGGATATPEEMIELARSGTYPNVQRVFASGYEFRADDQYALGLSAMLDGLEARFTAKRAKRRRATT